MPSVRAKIDCSVERWPFARVRIVERTSDMKFSTGPLRYANRVYKQQPEPNIQQLEYVRGFFAKAE
jgi:hypothetical protein